MKVILRFLTFLAVLTPVIGLPSLLHHDAEYYCKAGVAKQASGDLDAAMLDYNNAIQLKPDYVDAFIGRGSAKYKTGDFKGALADYNEAIQINPALAPANHYVRGGQFSITNDLTKQVISFLAAKDYEKLDQLASILRLSKGRYVDGVWKLEIFYAGFIPPGNASDKDWDDRILAIKRWSQSEPDSITARIALANALTSYAWKIRGSTEEVAPANGELFTEKLRDSLQVLNQAKTLPAQCPYYWRVLMRDALGLQFDIRAFQDVFDGGLAAAPDCAAYYVGRAIYLLPQWNGKSGEWGIDLGNWADRIDGADSDVLYAQVVWSMDQRYDMDFFTDDNLVWSRVDKGFEAMEERFPTSLDAKIERANLAIKAHDAPFIAYYRSAGDKAGKGDLAGAIADYTKAVEEPNRDDFRAYCNRGIAKNSLGDYDGAFADYSKAIALKPGYADAYRARSALLKYRGDNIGASADAQKLAELSGTLTAAK